MKYEIDLNTWKRHDHFEFFNLFDEPLYGVTTKVECSNAYHRAKNEGYSFSLLYFYLSLQAVNEIEEFKYRIEEGKVYCYDKIGMDTTIFRDDETFGYGHFDFDDDINVFIKNAQVEIKKVREESGLKLTYWGENTIHYSTVPWFSFTALNHPRRFGGNQSIPKFTFGKAEWSGEKLWIPIDIHANHALIDGYHIGKFINRFQELLNEK